MESDFNLLQFSITPLGPDTTKTWVSLKINLWATCCNIVYIFIQIENWLFWIFHSVFILFSIPFSFLSSFWFGSRFNVLFPILFAILFAILLANSFATTIRILFATRDPVTGQQDSHRLHDLLFFDAHRLRRGVLKKSWENQDPLQESAIAPLTSSPSFRGRVKNHYSLLQALLPLRLLEAMIKKHIQKLKLRDHYAFSWYIEVM